jgi:hypothetical protein
MTNPERVIMQADRNEDLDVGRRPPRCYTRVHSAVADRCRAEEGDATWLALSMLAVLAFFLLAYLGGSV